MVVLRHSERQDYVDKSYGSSEEGKAWPHDAPLTQKGVELAKSVAAELADLSSRKGANFVAVASSPYRRCLETAAEVSKLLDLPVLIDQEIGEVRERVMPKDKPAHRRGTKLKELAKALGIRPLNPELEDGSLKIFGKQPNWPESLEDAKNRYIVRIETYIRQSAEQQQNMIVVTHADAVGAALVMFERGGADVQSMGFCARVIVNRTIKQSRASDSEKSVYAHQWEVDVKDVGQEVFHDPAMAKYYEKVHLETCDETEQMAFKRKEKRTKTDMLFDSTLKKLNLDPEEEDDDDDEEKGGGEGNHQGKSKT
jgi:broad specificity phosphatase PhoE